MTLTILYLNPCRRERLRAAFAHTLIHLGPLQAAAIVEALVQAYQPENALRTDYNFARHALHYGVGIEGLAAISLVKVAWNDGSLDPSHGTDGTHGQEPASIITHPSTNTTQ